MILFPVLFLAIHIEIGKTMWRFWTPCLFSAWDILTYTRYPHMQILKAYYAKCIYLLKWHIYKFIYFYAWIHCYITSISLSSLLIVFVILLSYSSSSLWLPLVLISMIKVIIRIKWRIVTRAAENSLFWRIVTRTGTFWRIVTRTRLALIVVSAYFFFNVEHQRIE